MFTDRTEQIISRMGDARLAEAGPLTAWELDWLFQDARRRIVDAATARDLAQLYERYGVTEEHRDMTGELRQLREGDLLRLFEILQTFPARKKSS